MSRMSNLLKNYFRQELPSRTPDVEIRQGLVCTAAGLRFLSPALKLHHQRTHFQWNHWEQVTFLLLFHRRPLVVGLNCPDGLASRYAIMVVQRTLTDVALRQWFVRCGSVYACSLWQEVRFKTRFCRLRDWTSFFDHLLVSETEHLRCPR